LIIIALAVRSYHGILALTFLLSQTLSLRRLPVAAIGSFEAPLEKTGAKDRRLETKLWKIGGIDERVEAGMDLKTLF
jgi:hypothetical protein